ncbi:hypothetical protein BKA70DRAFT_1234736 [Coprinopsis sp. MPI-PUGE-AT-0042]|nr:hypothetical protein BKA70DRAFT_1234736 [Coprinopsis sp. MPI-PUGE-AT-0042]
MAFFGSFLTLFRWICNTILFASPSDQSSSPSLNSHLLRPLGNTLPLSNDSEVEAGAWRRKGSAISVRGIDEALDHRSVVFTTGNPRVPAERTVPAPGQYPTRNPAGFTRYFKPKNAQIGAEMTEIYAISCSLTKSSISRPFLARLGRFWARFKTAGYRNRNPYPNPTVCGSKTRRVTRTRGEHYRSDEERWRKEKGDEMTMVTVEKIDEKGAPRATRGPVP